MNTAAHPVLDPDKFGTLVSAEFPQGLRQTPSGLLVDEKLLEDSVPFQIGEKVPFKGWVFQITGIGPGSITLQAIGRTGKYKKVGSMKRLKKVVQGNRGSNRTPSQKEKRKRRKK